MLPNCTNSPAISPISSEVPTTEMRAGFAVSPQQAAVIDHLASSYPSFTVASAGAGAGKTYTTVAAVLYAIEQERGQPDGASIDQFVLISFTNKAANELRVRIQEGIGSQLKRATSVETRFFWRQQQERLAGAYIGTIHGFCRRLLRLFGYLDNVAYETGITFAKDLRDQAFLQAILEEYKRVGDAKVYGGNSEMQDFELLKLMSRLYETVRNKNLLFQKLVERTSQQLVDFGQPYRVAMAQLLLRGVKYYYQAKQSKQLLDTHDLLARTVQLLSVSKNNESVRQQIAKRHQFLFIDEFQDTDEAQQKMIEALQPHLRAVLLVGDIKQSIYSFRGAQGTMLEKMSEKYMKQSPLPLNVSRRPTERFRKVVNTLFGHISQQVIKQERRYAFLGDELESYSDIRQGDTDPSPLHVVTAARDQQARVIAKLVKGFVEGTPNQSPRTLERKQHRTRPVEPGDFVILTRDNNQAARYATELNEIFAEPEFSDRLYSARREQGESFYSLPEIVSVLYILQLLLAYPNDDAALVLAMDTPYLRATQQSPIQDEKRRQTQRPTAGNSLSVYFQQHHPTLHRRLIELQETISTATIPQLLESLYRLFAIRQYYQQSNNEAAILNLEHLREIARHLFTQDQALTLPIFVDNLRRAKLSGREEEYVTPPKALDATDETPEVPYIRVMTVHSAKGLQFPVVIIPEMERPLVRGKQQEPSFLVSEDSGLEVKIKLASENADDTLSTVSSNFRVQLDREKWPQRQEEMRILYVGITRAEHSVILLGESNSVYSAEQPKYSWQSEILRAKQVLLAQQARFYVYENGALRSDNN
jgi:DNA helicase-2/ATP-dependent DNA helicase PcrA